MTDVPFHEYLEHNFPDRKMTRYDVLSAVGSRTVSSVINAVSDEDAIAAVSAYFGPDTIEISQKGRLVRSYASREAA
jgi:hypothetical protein